MQQLCCGCGLLTDILAAVRRLKLCWQTMSSFMFQSSQRPERESWSLMSHNAPLAVRWGRRARPVFRFSWHIYFLLTPPPFFFKGGVIWCFAMWKRFRWVRRDIGFPHLSLSYSFFTFTATLLFKSLWSLFRGGEKRRKDLCDVASVGVTAVVELIFQHLCWSHSRVYTKTGFSVFSVRFLSAFERSHQAAAFA